MIEVTFPRSQWAQHRVNNGASPNDYPDPTIIIPEEGELAAAAMKQTFGVSEPRRYFPVHPYRWQPSQPHVEWEYRESPGSPDSESWDRCTLLWIQERSQWVGVTVHAWIEGGGLEDQSIAGAFAIDELCARMIVRAWGIPESAISLDAVSTSSPETLEMLARRAADGQP
jgi:hypothetical protein